MYADETSLTLSAGDTTRPMKQVNDELECMRGWLLANRLTLDVARTEFMFVTTRQFKRPFIDSNLNLNIEVQPVKQVNGAKKLALYLRQDLSWINQIEHIRKRLVLL